MTTKTEAGGKLSQLDKLKKQREQLEARIQDLQNRQNAEKHKADTRLKVLLGAAMLADLHKLAETDTAAAEKQRAEIVALLNRAIQVKRDREFLQELGWLRL